MGTLLEDCVLSYSCDDNDSRSIVTDRMDNHHGVLEQNSGAAGHDLTSVAHVDSGNPPYTNGALHLNSAYSLSIDAGLLASFFENMDEVSFEAFFATGDPTQNPDQYLFGVQQVSPVVTLWCNLNYWSGEPPGKLKFFCFAGSDVNPVLSFGADDNLSLTDGNYHHVVVIMKKSSGTGLLYVDGVSADITVTDNGTDLPFGALVAGNEFHIGAYHEAGEAKSWTNLKLELFRIFDREVTQAEITWLYNGGKGRGCLATQRLCFKTTVKPLIAMDINVKEC